MRYIRCLVSVLCVALAAPHEAFVPPARPVPRHRPGGNETAERYRVYEDMRRFFSPPRNTTTGHHGPSRADATADPCRDTV